MYLRVACSLPIVDVVRCRADTCIEPSGSSVRGSSSCRFGASTILRSPMAEALGRSSRLARASARNCNPRRYRRKPSGLVTD